MKDRTSYKRDEYILNREKAIERQKEYNSLHRIAVAERANKWNKENREKLAKKRNETYHCGLNKKQLQQKKQALYLLEKLEAIAKRNIANKKIYKEKRKELTELYRAYIVKFNSKRSSLNKELKNKVHKLSLSTKKGEITKLTKRTHAIQRELAKRKGWMQDFKAAHQRRAITLRKRYLA